MFANTESLKLLFLVSRGVEYIYIYSLLNNKNCLLKENYRNSFPWPELPFLLTPA